LVKDYEGPEQETTIAYQLAVTDVTYEDERYIVRVFREWLEGLRTDHAGTRGSTYR